MLCSHCSVCTLLSRIICQAVVTQESRYIQSSTKIQVFQNNISCKIPGRGVYNRGEGLKKKQQMFTVMNLLFISILVQLEHFRV